MAAFGGYDEGFLHKVADRLICHICTKSLREPRLTACCGHHFCESCLEQWSKKHVEQCCPFCRNTGEAFQHILDKKVKREIESLMVRCKHSHPQNPTEGCKWTGELGELDSHLNSEDGCGYVEIMCPNYCMEEVYSDDSDEYSYRDSCRTEPKYLLRKDLKQHLRYDCYLRPYECEHCGLKDTYEAITGDGCSFSSHDYCGDYNGHYDDCPEYPVTCPNKCGAENIKQKEVAKHRKTCQFEKVKCPFAKAGCNHSPLRKDEADHLEKSVVQHQLLMLKSQEQIQKEYEAKEGRWKEAIGSNLQSITSTCTFTEQQKFHLESICSLLKDSYCLKKGGDSFELDMFLFQHQDNVWKSPPFYLYDIHIMKLQLKVYVNGYGSGAGTHVSLTLVSLKRDSDFSIGSMSLFEYSSLDQLCYKGCRIAVNVGTHEWIIERKPCQCWWSEFEEQKYETIMDENETFITCEEAKKLSKEDGRIILKIQLYNHEHYEFIQWYTCHCDCHRTPEYSDYSDYDS